MKIQIKDIFSQAVPCSEVRNKKKYHDFFKMPILAFEMYIKHSEIQEAHRKRFPSKSYSHSYPKSHLIEAVKPEGIDWHKVVYQIHDTDSPFNMDGGNYDTELRQEFTETFHKFESPILVCNPDNVRKFVFVHTKDHFPIYIDKSFLVYEFRKEMRGSIYLPFLAYVLSMIIEFQKTPVIKEKVDSSMDMTGSSEMVVFSDNECIRSMEQLMALEYDFPSYDIQEKVYHEELLKVERLHSGDFLDDRKYLIKAAIGVGGFAKTYTAVCRQKDSPMYGKVVAIKELFLEKYNYRPYGSKEVKTGRTDKAREYVGFARHKFLGEIEKLQAISSPHIVKVYDVFEENNTIYYVMEYITGGSLKEKLSKDGVFSEDRAIAITNEIGNALKVMHAHNMLHLDVKPGNVLMRASGEIVLSDFGAAKVYNEDGIQCSGTPHITSWGFSAPEQYIAGGLKEFSPATDVYGLGVTLFYLLTNTIPDDKKKRWLDGMSRPVKEVIRRTVTHKKYRIKTIDEFLNVLNQSAESSDVQRSDVIEEDEEEYESELIC